MPSRVRFWLVPIAVAAFCQRAWSDEWPAYRHDAAHSASTSEEIKLPLALAWTWAEDPPPAPAWDVPARQDYFHKHYGLNRLDEFDLAYQPIIAEGRVYIGSSSTDTLHCLDGGSGRPLWRWVAEAPVRVVPAYHDRRVYCGSDDGWLVCLDAASGKACWRTFLGLADRRLPGNSRMISRWPIRSGLVVSGNRVYCTSGVFPDEGVFLCAVSRDDGHVIWKRELSSSPYGPMIASATRLLVPMLRAPTQAFDLVAGTPAGDAGPGGSCAGVNGDKFVAGVHEIGGITGLDPKTSAALAGAKSLQFAVASDGGMVLASDRLLLAVDSANRPLWKIELNESHALLVAGGLAFVGGRDSVIAVRRIDGRVVWRGAVPGTVRAIAAGNQMLLAATDDGRIHCFASAATLASGGQTIAALPSKRRVPNDDVILARRILQGAGVSKGYCLVLDADGCELPRALASQSEMHVIAVEREKEKIDEEREALRAERLYGPRIVVHRWSDTLRGQFAGAAMLPYPDWVFDLIVLRVRNDSRLVPAIAAAEAWRTLRPDGGTLVVLADAKVDRAPLEKWGSAVTGWNVEARDGKGVWTVHRGPLAGGGEWTHQYASAGNTACSDDAIARGPTELQWFGPPGPQSMVDRHNRASAPLFHRGRLLIAGEDCLTGVDAYNGAILWQTTVPQSLRLAVSNDCGCMAAGDGMVYVAANEQCLQMDVASGQRHGQFAAPGAPGAARAGSQSQQRWNYVGYTNGTLVGSAAAEHPAQQGSTARRLVLSPDSWSFGYLDQMPVGCSRSLFAYDVPTRSLLWRYEPERGLIVNPTIALASGQAVFVQGQVADERLLLEDRIASSQWAKQGTKLVALDLRTGHLAWTRAVDLSAVQTSPFLTISGDTVLFSGAKNVGRRLQFELHAFRRRDGEPLWTRSFGTGQDVGGSHGEQNQHPVVVGDRAIFKRFACSLPSGEIAAGWRLPDGGCGTLSASRGDCFFRCSGPAGVDLSTAEMRMLSTVTRPGCWINIIPAGGLVLIPEGSSGCTCPYPLQTSMALRPVDCPSPQIASIVSQRAGHPCAGGERSSSECRFVKAVRIEITHPDPAAALHYTLDGTWPTHASPAYLGPFDRDGPTTVRAIAELPSGRQSLAVRRQFAPVDAPRVISPSSKFVTRMSIALEPLEGAARLRCTLDGSEVTPVSPVYEGPIEITKTTVLTAAYSFEDRLCGKVLRQRFDKVPGAAAVEVPDLETALDCAYYEGAWQQLPEFEKLAPRRTAMAEDFSLPTPRSQFYALRFRGYLKVPVDGVYRFFVRSDDGSRLRVAGRTIVDYDGLHDARRERSGEIALAQGRHAINVDYFNGGLQDALFVYYQGPGVPKQLIPPEVLFHSAND